MKYYSELTNELYDSPEELAQGELLATECCCDDCDDDCSCNEKQLQDEVKQPSKKQLAAKIEEAEKAVDEAHANYELAKKQVEELSKAYLAEVDKIIEPAKKQVKEAEQQRYNAIRDFNNSFGAYQTTYTGAKAANQFVKALNELNNMRRSFFGNSFWF